MATTVERLGRELKSKKARVLYVERDCAGKMCFTVIDKDERHYDVPVGVRPLWIKYLAN
jgi:hypothetical protein